MKKVLKITKKIFTKKYRITKILIYKKKSKKYTKKTLKIILKW